MGTFANEEELRLCTVVKGYSQEATREWGFQRQIQMKRLVEGKSTRAQQGKSAQAASCLDWKSGIKKAIPVATGSHVFTCSLVSSEPKPPFAGHEGSLRLLCSFSFSVEESSTDCFLNFYFSTRRAASDFS